jgi:hypothetical protein
VMIDEIVVMHMEETGVGLTWGNVPEFAWMYLTKPTRNLRVSSLWAEIWN